MAIIYKTTNILNGKFYIGKDERDDPNYLGSGIILKQAIAKYGRKNFKKKLLERCNDSKKLCEREVFWIAQLKPPYNIAKGGTGGNALKYASKEKKKSASQKISISHFGSRNPMYGKKHKASTLRKISKRLRGKKRSRKTKKEIEVALRRRWETLKLNGKLDDYKQKHSERMKLWWGDRKNGS